MSVDLNKMAVRVTRAEGLKKSLSIAQCKEVIKITLKELKGLTLEEVTKLLSRVK